MDNCGTSGDTKNGGGGELTSQEPPEEQDLTESNKPQTEVKIEINELKTEENIKETENCDKINNVSNIAVESNHCNNSHAMKPISINSSDTVLTEITPNSNETTDVCQDDSALCISPKSLCSVMDTSGEKSEHGDMEHDLDLSAVQIRKNDSGISFEKNDFEVDIFESKFVEGESEILKKIDSNNLSDPVNEKDGEQATCSKVKKDALCDIDNNCDNNIEQDVKGIDLDSDDLSDNNETTKEKKKEKVKKKKLLDDSDSSDTSGPNTYEVNPSKKEKKNDDSGSDNSDIEQEMDALDLFLSRRKQRHDSNESHDSNDDDAAQNEEDNSSRPAQSDNLDETKSDDSDHSDSDTELDITPPPDRWNPLKETRAREIGFGNKCYAPERFRRQCGSSVRLVQRLKRNCKLESHDGCVNALHFNRSGNLLASGSDDLNIVVWDWVAVKPYFVFDSGHRSNVFQCKFMPYTGDSHIVSCARDGQLRLAELSATGVCKGTKKLAQHKGAAHKLALLEDSSHLFYSCGEDAVVYCIDLREDKPTKLCTTKENDKKIPLYSIHSNPMKSFEYCVGGRDHFIRIYDKRMLGGDGTADNVLKKYCPHHLVDSEIKANVTCAVYNWDGQEVLGTYNDEDIYLFDSTHSDGAQHIHKYKGHRNNATVKGINFYGPKSEFIVSGSDCGNVFLWEKETEKIVTYFHADEGGVVNVLEPHPHMPVLATSGLDHDVKIWTPMGGEPTKMDGLAKRIRKNTKERERERINEPEMLDGRMLWFLMHHLRRARRRPQGDGDSSTDSDDVERGTSDQSDDDDDSDEPMQCAPS